MLEGLQLLVVGMGTVFAFLGLLVALMHGSARVLAGRPEALAPPPAGPPGLDTTSEAEIAVAIAVAAARASGGGGR